MLNINTISIGDIKQFGFSLAPSSYNFIHLKKQLSVLQSKYENIFECFDSFDGYAFSSSDYVTKYQKKNNTVPLIQIGNVNESFLIHPEQEFAYLPNTHILSKSQYLLKDKYILISLTGGDDVDINITSFFDASFLAFLNQRVSAFHPKRKDEDLMYYFYALTKHKVFNIQWLGRGGVQNNTVSKERERTYLPLIRDKQLLRYISILIQSAIHKEKEIYKKNQASFDIIEKEIMENQSPHYFKYEQPNIKDILGKGRIDAGYYSADYKRKLFLIKNYYLEAKELLKWGYDIERGQNLQESCIGTSAKSKMVKNNFYTVIRPTNFTAYGTIQNYEYLGNPNMLSCLNPGDIVFSAEGTIGKCVLFINPKEKCITNIHGIVLNKKDHNVNESAFVASFLRFLQHWQMFDYISVGGQGGSLAKQYWEDVIIPNFPEPKQREIACLYHNPKSIHLTEANLDNFLDIDTQFNNQAGILELDVSLKIVKEHLLEIIDQIIMDKQVIATFQFIMDF